MGLYTHIIIRLVYIIKRAQSWLIKKKVKKFDWNCAFSQDVPTSNDLGMAWSIHTLQDIYPTVNQKPSFDNLNRCKQCD